MPHHICTVNECDRPLRTAGSAKFCTMHYQRFRKYGRLWWECPRCLTRSTGPLPAKGYRYCCGTPTVTEWRHSNPVRARAGRLRERAAKYDLTVEELARLRAQDCCNICGATDPGSKNDWHVDHDEETGRVRGLLCLRCNQGIGRFEHDIELFRRIISYLENPPGIPPG